MTSFLKDLVHLLLIQTQLNTSCKNIYYEVISHSIFFVMGCFKFCFSSSFCCSLLSLLDWVRSHFISWVYPWEVASPWHLLPLIPGMSQNYLCSVQQVWGFFCGFFKKKLQSLKVDLFNINKLEKNEMFRDAQNLKEKSLCGNLKIFPFSNYMLS